jgi:hypothetical protein
MAVLITLLSLLAMIAACLGSGAGVLYIFGLWKQRETIERLALSFAVGFGVLGWMFYWLGLANLYNLEATWAICLLMACGMCLFYGEQSQNVLPYPFSILEWLLIILIAVALTADFFEGLAPPVEADSLAYHFQLPKQFIEEGRLFFVSRALDGAIPLLVQMTYVAALSLGGNEDTTLTLWTFASGWAPGFLLFVYSRRWLPRHWRLALFLLFQTLPAMLYGAGSGHVEPRMAMFVLIAFIGLIELKDNPRLGPILLIGLGVGLYAGSKYTGLLFIAAAGVSVLIFSGRHWFRNGFVYSLTLLLVGGQWYAWNTYHTGDPVFPILFSALGLEDGAFWDADYAASMRDYLVTRNDQISWWERWLIYPFSATLFPTFSMEAGRVGFGPYFLMIAPFSMAGVWHQRNKIVTSSLAPAALMVILFYLLWLGFGGVPKVRHLLPILPVVLLCMSVGLLKTIRAWPDLCFPISAAMVICLGINLSVVGLFSRPYLAHAVSGFDREVFLNNNINGYPAVAWLNQQNEIVKVLLTYRAYRYHVRPASFYAFPGVQKLIEARVGRVSAGAFWKQMRVLKISHILTDRPTSMSFGKASIDAAIKDLAKAGCLDRMKEIKTPWRISRTLLSLGSRQLQFDVWRLNSVDCSYNK